MLKFINVLTRSKSLILPLVLMFSMVLVAYSPMAAYTSAQTANSNKLKEMKEQATQELERRIDGYKKTLKSMETDVKISKETSSAKITSDKGEVSGTLTRLCANDEPSGDSSSPSPTPEASFKLGKEGLAGTIALPCTLKEKTKEFLQKVIEGLTGMVEKVKNTNSLTEMTALGQNINAQFDLNKLTEIQALVTQSIETMTGVLENMKSSYNKLKGQVAALKECMKGLKSGETEVTGNITLDGAEVNCGEFDLSSSDIAEKAQSQLSSLSTVITTISSVVSSSVSLMMSLVSSFTGMVGGLGSLGSLGNLGNLGSMLGGGGSGGMGGLSSLLGSTGSISGIMSSFTAITSQLDIANFMSGNVSSGLSGLGNLVNLGGLGL